MEDIFKKIIEKKIPAKIIHDDEKAIAFYDIKPESKWHFLVVPKKHSFNMIDIDDKTLNYLILLAKELAIKELKKHGLSSFKLVINNGEAAGQVVGRTHIHIIPK